MRHSQVIVFDHTDRLAALLRPLCEEMAWSLREPKQPSTVHRLVDGESAAVVVLRTGKDLEREIHLLDRLNTSEPDIPVIVVSESEHAPFLDLVWTLGAAYVLHPTRSKELLVDLVKTMLGKESINRQSAMSEP